MARILVVDDENNIRMMIRLALQQVGYEVDTAAEGNEALFKFGTGKPYDLILLDQRMPGLEGIQVLKQMRFHDPNAKIIMATAFGTIDLAVEAIKEGATDFLRKPFTVETLRGAVEAALQPGQPAVSSGVTFGYTTINGYRIEFDPASSQHTESEFRQLFTVRSPEGQSQPCTVALPGYICELVKAHTDREEVPGGDRFWQALCEEALANFLWQNADFPPGGILRVEELTSGLRRFADAVLAA